MPYTPKKSKKEHELRKNYLEGKFMDDDDACY